MTTQPQFIPYHFQKIHEAEMVARSKIFYELMNLRRSVREFSPEPLPDEVIQNAMRTAGTSPSGAHKQPWFFCVVKDRVIKHKIRLAAEAEEKENYTHRFTPDWLADLAILGTDEVKEYIDIAPALIVVFKENFRIVDDTHYKNYYVNESVGIAVGFLIAALHNAGVATLTHTPNPMNFLSEILDRPKNETPIILMPIGYPKDGTMIPNLKRKSLDQIMKVF